MKRKIKTFKFVELDSDSIEKARRNFYRPPNVEVYKLPQRLDGVRHLIYDKTILYGADSLAVVHSLGFEPVTVKVYPGELGAHAKADKIVFFV